MIQTFDRDLARGKKYEQIVLEAIQQKYSKAFIEDGYCKEWDIYIPELSFGIEVKSDKKSIDTGNIVIEIEFNGKPSALSTTKSKYWVIFDGYDYKWFLVDDIKKCIEENNLRYATFTGKGDIHSKKAYLIKKKILYNHSHQI